MWTVSFAAKNIQFSEKGETPISVFKQNVKKIIKIFRDWAGGEKKEQVTCTRKECVRTKQSK